MAGGRHRRRWWIVGLVVVVVLLVGGPFVYIHLIEGPAPAKLSLPRTSTPVDAGGSSSTQASLDGTWSVGSGSIVGYRVQEVLIGQHATAVGRTAKVSGSVSISGTSVTRGSFTVDMASVESDQSERNAQFDGRIMDVSAYPTSTLVLTEPIDLGTVPADGSVEQLAATGDLTMHGVTKSVSFKVSGQRSGDTIYVLADIPIVFAEWDISNPSIGGFVTTQSSGTLEVLLHLTRGPGNAPVTGSSSTAPVTQGGGGPVTVPKTTVPPLQVPSG
ncbi:MAG: YceI family protein [Acidimicrobiales bacterium]